MGMLKPMSAIACSFVAIISLAGCGSGGGSTPSAANSPTIGSEGGSPGTTSPGVATSAGVATLAWDPPEPGVVGFKVHYGTSSGTYTSTLDAGATPSYTVSGLSSGTYYFAVTANDSSGNESSYSNEVSKTIN